MIDTMLLWLLVAAFGLAGLVNATGLASARTNLVRWGYPSWWGYLTGGLEVLAAILIVFTATRIPGLLLGMAIIAAALATVLRHRDFPHLAPLGLFAALLCFNAC